MTKEQMKRMNTTNKVIKLNIVLMEEKIKFNKFY